MNKPYFLLQWFTEIHIELKGWIKMFEFAITYSDINIHFICLAVYYYSFLINSVRCCENINICAIFYEIKWKFIWHDMTLHDIYIVYTYILTYLLKHFLKKKKKWRNIHTNEKSDNLTEWLKYLNYRGT